MSLMRRIFSYFQNSTRYVGRDLEGNRFYEFNGISMDQRTKRMVQYKDPSNVWNYIGGGKRLPVQWSMWLSHTRKDPPSLEELQRDLERQQRVIENASLIEKRDEEERHERLRLEQNLRKEIAADRTQVQEVQEPSPPSNDSSILASKKDGTPLLGQGLSSASDEPQSWSPQLRRRG